MKRLFSVLLAILFCSNIATANTDDNYILCINSYTQSSSWFKRIMHQVTEYAEYRPDLFISTEHLQIPLIENQEESSEKFITNLRSKYKKSPSALILLGNEAYSLRDEYRNIWGDVPIILCTSQEYVSKDTPLFEGEAIPTDKRVYIKDIANKYNTTFFYTNSFLEENLDYIKEQTPKIEELVFIRNSRQLHKNIELDIRELLAKKYPQISFRLATSAQMSTNELIGLINGIDTEKTAVLFSSWFNKNDINENESILSSIQALIALCNVPFFILNTDDIITLKEKTIRPGVSFDFDLFKKSFHGALESIIYKNVEARDIASFYPTECYYPNSTNFPQEIIYSDLPSRTIFVNRPPTFFEKNQMIIYLFLGLAILFAFFFFSYSRVVKTKEEVIKALAEEQKGLIKDLNIALRAGNILRWRVDGRARQIVMFDHNMNQANLTTDELLDLTKTPKDKQILTELLDNLSETEVRTAITYHNTPWDETYRVYEASVIALSTETGDCYGICHDITDNYNYQLALKESDAQKELIFNNISSILVYLNANFEVQWTNIHTVLGEKVAGSYKQGQKCYESLGLDTPCACCPVVRTMKTMKIERSETDKFLDGNIYEEVANPIVGDSGIEGVVVKLENITERKKLISELSSTNQLINTMLEALPMPLAIEDVKNDFKYVYVSSVFCDKIVGKKREEIIGFSDYDLFDKTIADLFRSYSINILTNHNNGEIVNLGEVPMIIQGEEYTLSLKARYLKLTNGEEYIMTQASDVTDIKRMNNELKKAKNKAEEADKLKSAFLANMSHEIRTPLNAIVGFSELLKHAETPEEKDEYMGIIDTNNDLLLRLIGDILDLSKLDSGTLKLYPEEFDFSLFFTETYSTLKPRCEHSEIELKIHNPLSNCRVTLDKNRVLQILTNYINNAVKFTKKGYIEMGYDYINKGIQFYVKDSGIGVSEEKKEFLFQRFEKLDNFAQGTGLGLSICKAIAEQMEGRVWAESTEGKGSTFFAWIPCEAAVQEEASQKEENPSSLEKDENKETSNIRKSLLVAEDNNSNYLLLQAVLKEYDLTRAVDGVEAVKYAKQYKYDAILMDMRMPNMDGLEATRKIREFDKETLIIAVTANAFDSDRLNAISAGCNSFITKPIKKQALIEAIS